MSETEAGEETTDAFRPRGTIEDEARRLMAGFGGMITFASACHRPDDDQKIGAASYPAQLR